MVDFAVGNSFNSRGREFEARGPEFMVEIHVARGRGYKKAQYHEMVPLGHFSTVKLENFTCN